MRGRQCPYCAEPREPGDKEVSKDETKTLYRVKYKCGTSLFITKINGKYSGEYMKRCK